MYIQVPVLVALLWIFTSYISATFPALRGKRICLLIAHPDDEAMFFAPSVLALTQPHLGNHLKILCLSSGDADGLGEIRKKELANSALHLGLRSSGDVLVLEDTRFPDSMTTIWDAKAISNLLTSTFAPQMAKLSDNTKPDANIDVLVTFDKSGVSGHPNHIALYHGAVTFARSLTARHQGWEAPVKLYTLPSVNLLRKYVSILDIPLTIMWSLIKKKQGGDFPTPLLFVSGMGQYRRAQGAMTTAHKSQMVWFRWGWITLSRYMVVNDLQKEKGI